MTDANSRQVALQNLRDFQEMSYADVYALIRQKRFDEAKVKYTAVLENMDIEQFRAALDINISSPHDVLLDCMSSIASRVYEPEKIRAVGFDLSAHAMSHDQNGKLSQGIEVSLYSEDVYDFSNASDEQLRMQCESTASEWQGCFMEIDSVGLDGLGKIAQQFQDYAKNQNNLQGIIESQDGAVIVDPNAIAKHVAKLLVAIEYHRYMAEFVEEVEVPSQMVFIIGEHDEIEVPIVFYRVGEADVSVTAQQVMPAEDTPEPAIVAEELPHEEAPAMYHSAEPVEESYLEEPKVQKEEATSTHLGGELYEAARKNLAENYQAEPVLEPIQEPEEVSTESRETEEVSYEEPTAGEKAKLGKTLAPKAFGRRSNEIFKDEADVEVDKEADKEKSA